MRTPLLAHSPDRRASRSLRRWATRAHATVAIEAPEAERALLGAILLRPALFERALPLEPDEFYRHGHARIFATMLRMRSAGRAIDTVTVREELAAQGELALAGGDDTLLDLTHAIPVPEHLPDYAAIIRERAMRRRIAELGTMLLARARRGDTSEALLSYLEDAVVHLGARTSTTTKVRSLGVALLEPTARVGG